MKTSKELISRRRREMRVGVMKKEVVAAVLPMQEHWLPPSNLDLLLPPVAFGVFMCYNKRPSPTSPSSSSVLKKALAQALVTYYPFAGEVVPNSMGEPELLCNNRGVDFIEAVADVHLQHLDFFNPDHSFEAKLVPHNNPPALLTIQATELKCGGLVVACTFDHRIADAFSANMFLVSWAEMARSQSQPQPTMVPCFRRSLLNPRRPVCVEASLQLQLERMYMPVSSLPPPPPSPSPSHLLISSRIFYVPSRLLSRLQLSLPSRTKLECFSAFLWKMIAQCECRGHSTEATSRMGVVVDGRSALQMGSTCYFGNVLSIPYGEESVGALRERPLPWVADRVHSFVRGAATGDHFRGLIDWVEGQRPHPACTRVYGATMEDGPAFVVSSGARFPEDKLDFGWGAPALASYHFPWGGQAGYVMPMPSPLRNGDWIVYMHLFQHHLDYIQAHAPHFFIPLTWDYLNSNT